MQRSRGRGSSSDPTSQQKFVNAGQAPRLLSSNYEAPAKRRTSRRSLGELDVDVTPPSRTSSTSHTPETPIGVSLQGRSREFIRTVRRQQLRQMVPLSDTTIYEMEQRGEFPKRFYLTPRCAAWDLGEVQGWIELRRRASAVQAIKPTQHPDVGLRKSRPVRRQRPPRSAASTAGRSPGCACCPRPRRRPCRPIPAACG